MGEKDITEKTLESYNDVFADIVNGLIFDGRQIVKEDDLLDATPMSYYKASGKVHEQARDVAKQWVTRNICISLIGLENQTRPDRYMPIRTLMYDAVAYHDQLAQLTQKAPPGTGRRRKKGVYPTITLVLYLGYKERWNMPHSLQELIHADIPEELEPWIQNYRINLAEIAWMSLEEVNRRFHGDFRVLANYLVQKHLHQDYVPDLQTLRHAREVLHLLSLIERDHRYENIYNELVLDSPSGEEGQWNMCDVLDKAINRGIQMERENTARVLDQEREQTARGMRDIGMTLEQIATVLRTDVPTVTRMLQ